MPEPLRRRVRRRLLDGLSASVDGPAGPWVQGGLRALASAARFSSVEARTRANLAAALGATHTKAERARIARAVRHHAARLAWEWARLKSAERGDAQRTRVEAWLDDVVTIPEEAGLERLRAEQAQGRGLLIATAHIGNWELLAASLRRLGLRGAVVGLRKHRDSSADWLVRMREAYGVETLPQDIAPRALLDRLRGGDTLGLLTDLEVRRLAGVMAPFFGRPALTMTAPAALARAARVPAFPVRCVGALEDGAWRYRILVDEPLHFDRELPKADATLAFCTELNATFERWIRADPEQWAWHQDRWRTRPGEREAIPYAARRARDAARLKAESPRS